MCTSLSFKHYFGRNLDYDKGFGEKIIIVPREYPLKYRNYQETSRHYSFFGTGIVSEKFPLMFDAVNEKGLYVSGLEFPYFTDYKNAYDGKTNIASFEFIPYILCRCDCINSVRELLKEINITNEGFNEKLILTPLHWHIADSEQSVTVECLKEGIKVYLNSVGVLTNNPPFPLQTFNLNNYLNITANEPESRFADDIKLYKYSKGMGALGLPGDFSSQSRFVRAAFNKLNAEFCEDSLFNINQLFHILNSVEQIDGCVKSNGKSSKTIYTACYDAKQMIYYYKTYENTQIANVNLLNETLDSDKIIVYNHLRNKEIVSQN